MTTSPSNCSRRTRRVVVAAMVLFALTGGRSQAQEPAEARTLSRRLEEVESLQLSLQSQLNDVRGLLVELRRAGTPPRAAGPPPPALPQNPIPLTSMALKGDPGAGVVIVEYSDFQCPYCGAFARQTLPALTRQYIDTGKVRLGFSNLPLAEIHPFALDAAEAAECAREQGKFWDMHDSLFADQAHLDAQSLVARVKKLGLDLPSFGTCVQNAGGAKVRRDLAAAKELGIAVTPTFVIGTLESDGSMKARQMLVGARDLAAFAEAIDPLLP